MTVYISEPITGKRNGNRKAFEKAQKKIENEFGCEEGKFRIISPVKIAETVNRNFEDARPWLDKAIKPQWEDYIKACIKRLIDATHVFFLKGWDKSQGAILERKIAEGLNIPCAETIEELKNSKGVDTWK